MFDETSTEQGSVARLPRRALGRRLAGARTWLYQLELDEALAHGANPWSAPELLLRAQQLTARAQRHRLADALERVLWASHGGRWLSHQIRVRRWEILEERDHLLTLADVLRAPGPVPVPVVAQLVLLVMDGASPLYVGRGPSGRLAATVRNCLEQLETSTV